MRPATLTASNPRIRSSRPVASRMACRFDDACRLVRRMALAFSRPRRGLGPSISPASRGARSDTMGKLDGKIALVTGGNSGIGRATAERLVAEGAYVFITGRRQVELDLAVKKIGKNVTALQGDVSSGEDLDRVYGTIKTAKGHLDVLFANAGVAEYAPLGDITEAQFDRMFDINVKGVLFTVQKALPLLRDGASVILNGSVVGSRGLPANSVYAATKAAVRSFARTWTTDLKARKIRVNTVSPGPIDTEGMEGLLGSG